MQVQVLAEVEVGPEAEAEAVFQGLVSSPPLLAAAVESSWNRSGSMGEQGEVGLPYSDRNKVKQVAQTLHLRQER